MNSASDSTCASSTRRRSLPGVAPHAHVSQVVVGGQKKKKVTEYYLGKSKAVLDAMDRLKSNKPVTAPAAAEVCWLHSIVIT